MPLRARDLHENTATRLITKLLPPAKSFICVYLLSTTHAATTASRAGIYFFFHFFSTLPVSFLFLGSLSRSAKAQSFGRESNPWSPPPPPPFWGERKSFGCGVRADKRERRREQTERKGGDFSWRRVLIEDFERARPPYLKLNLARWGWEKDNG